MTSTTSSSVAVLPFNIGHTSDKPITVQESLLSLIELVKHNDGSFSEDPTQLTLNNGDYFWCCSATELTTSRRTVQSLTTTVACTFHLTDEERRRATEVYCSSSSWR